MSLIITIDGTAGSGKGTLAKELADALQFLHLDTGLLYRKIAWELKRQQLPIEATHAAKIAQELLLPIESDPNLRTPEISMIASQVATQTMVREALLPVQRNFAFHPPSPIEGVVLDGRDTGSVICPDAHAKIFLSASLEVRARRRYLELGKTTPLEKVQNDIKERDARDEKRTHAPLVIPEGAKIIDTSDHTPAQTLKICLAWLKSLSMIQQ